MAFDVVVDGDDDPDCDAYDDDDTDENNGNDDAEGNEGSPVPTCQSAGVVSTVFLCPEKRRGLQLFASVSNKYERRWIPGDTLVDCQIS